MLPLDSLGRAVQDLFLLSRSVLSAIALKSYLHCTLDD